MSHGFVTVGYVTSLVAAVFLLSWSHPAVSAERDGREVVQAGVKRYDLALDDQSEAIRRDSASAELHDSRGQSYARNNAYDLAIVDYTEAIRLKPMASYYLNRGTAYQLKGDVDLAIADFDKAIALDNKLALAYNNRGMALRAKGNRPRALMDFTAAVRLDPNLEVAVEQRKSLALEIERIGAQMPLKGKDTGR